MELTTLIKQASRQWHAAQAASEQWNWPGFSKAAGDLETSLRLAATELASWLPGSQAGLSRALESVGGAAYLAELAAEFDKSGLEYSGEFPEYVILPYRLKFTPLPAAEGDAPPQWQVRLWLGKRYQSTPALLPAAIAAWVAQCQKRLTAKGFNHKRCCSDLLRAYQMAQRQFQASGAAAWGRPVPLQLLYELLTLRTESRSDYTLDMYIYDLYRLLASELQFERYQFEFGFSRNAGKTYEVRDRTGAMQRYSTLTVYQNEVEEAHGLGDQH